MRQYRLGFGVAAMLLGMGSFVFVDARQPPSGDNLLLLFGPTLLLMTAGAWLIAGSGPKPDPESEPENPQVVRQQMVVGHRTYFPTQESSDAPRNLCGLLLQDHSGSRSWVVVEGSVRDYPIYSHYPPGPSAS